MTYLAKAQALQQMLVEGKAMDALEQFYHNDVTVVEATGETRQGKAKQQEAIQEWYGSVKEMHNGGIGAITANEDAGITVAETWTDITYQNGKRVKMEEVAVQKWEEGKIVHERFYYNPTAFM